MSSLGLLAVGVGGLLAMLALSRDGAGSEQQDSTGSNGDIPPPPPHIQPAPYDPSGYTIEQWEAMTGLRAESQYLTDSSRVTYDELSAYLSKVYYMRNVFDVEVKRLLANPNAIPTIDTHQYPDRESNIAYLQRGIIERELEYQKLYPWITNEDIWL